jgi:hypothetical protein
MRRTFPFTDVESVEHDVLNFIIFLRFGIIPRVIRPNVAQSIQRLATGRATEGSEFESL